MSKKRAVALVMRFFSANRQAVECEAKHENGKCMLMAHRFSGNVRVKGERFVLARADSWEQCVRQVIPL